MNFIILQLYSRIFKKFFLVLLTIFLLLWSWIYVNASDKKIVLHSASEADYPPFCIVTKAGKADGFSVELLKYVANIMDMEISFKVGPWYEIKDKLQTGIFDVLPLVAYSTERAQYFDFSVPYLVLYGGIFTRNDNMTINTEGDLYGSEVIVMEGGLAYEYVLKNQLTDKIIKVKSYADAFKMLSEGKHDAIVVQKLVGLRIKDKLKLSNIKLVGKNQSVIEDTLRPLGRDLKGFEEKFCFAVPKGKHAILTKLNEGLLTAFNDGTYNKLYHKWFPFLQNQVNILEMIKYISIAIVAIVIIVLLSGFLILKKQVKIRTREIEHLSKFPSENPSPVIRVDFNKTILYINKGARQILSKKDIKAGSKIKRWEKLIEEIIATNKIKHNIETNEGDKVFSWTMVPVLKQRYINIYGTDSTKRIIAGINLQQSEKRFRDVAFSIADWIWEVDKEGRYTYCSEKVKDVLGYSVDEVIGKTAFDFMPPEEAEKIKDNFGKIVGKKISIVDLENWNITKDGKRICLQTNAIPILDEKGNLTGYRGIDKDITKRKEMEQQVTRASKKLETLAFIDTLTGVTNRKPFMDLFKNNISRAKREGKKLALLFMDLENFKNINDIYGHEIGDKALAKAANKIKYIARDSDLIGRTGGDEFVICLNDIKSLSGAIRIAKKINVAFSKKIKINNLELDIGISIGISVYPDDGKSVADLLKNSDLAMYSAKKQRRNSYHVYNEDLEKELLFDQALRHALEKNEFKIDYQVIVDKNQKPFCAEALLRWESPTFGTVMPMDFIPILEQNRSIIEVGEWVFKEACNKLKTFNYNAQNQVYVSANISQFQIEDDLFVNKIENIMRETKVDPKNILIEITEEIQIKKTKKVKKTLLQLKKIGIGLIALDDFGTGYSSFSNLINYPIDIVKIDKFFIDRLDAEKYSIITSGLVPLMKKYGLQVVAEGVETKRQFELLKDMGCDYFQGYYFFKPQRDVVI
jgi:diguanylate cyclase (GGDEF)-like protein/PAS domain S-box-containing protein